MKNCIALVFLPENKIKEQFDILFRKLNVSDKAQLSSFIEYFSSTWLDGLYSIQIGNKYGLDIKHRTNNYVEGWHSYLDRVIPIHPNIYVFIKGIKDMPIPAHAQIIMAKATAGHSPPKSKLKYIRLDKKNQKSIHKASSW